MKTKWRRWRPKIRPEPQQAQAQLQDAWDIFDSVGLRIKRLQLTKRRWQKGTNSLEALVPTIESAERYARTLAEKRAEPMHIAEAWLYALVLQAPRAAEAQLLMDKHPHGYHDKQARLYELIDFNDALVATVLALPQEVRAVFESYAKQLMDTMCKKARTRCFSNEEFDAIIHGLSREIAVYLGVAAEGYQPEMTNRATDAFGIDMRIIDPQTMRYVDVDVKTRSAFHYRIHDLEREGRISEEELIMADRNGFVAVYNGRGDERRKVVIWRIDHEVLGDIVDFRFKDTRALGAMFKKIVLYTGEKL